MIYYLFMAFIAAMKGFIPKELKHMSASLNAVIAKLVEQAKASRAAAVDGATRVNAHLDFLETENKNKTAQITALEAQLEKLKNMPADTTESETVLESIIAEMKATQTTYEALDKTPAPLPPPVTAPDVSDEGTATPTAPVTTKPGVSAADGSVLAPAPTSPASDGEGNTPVAAVDPVASSPSAGVGSFAPGAAPIA